MAALFFFLMVTKREDISVARGTTEVKHCAGKVTSDQGPSEPSKMELVDHQKNKGGNCREEHAMQPEILHLGVWKDIC